MAATSGRRAHQRRSTARPPRRKQCPARRPPAGQALDNARPQEDLEPVPTGERRNAKAAWRSAGSKRLSKAVAGDDDARSIHARRDEVIPYLRQHNGHAVCVARPLQVRIAHHREEIDHRDSGNTRASIAASSAACSLRGELSPQQHLAQGGQLRGERSVWGRNHSAPFPPRTGHAPSQPCAVGSDPSS